METLNALIQANIGVGAGVAIGTAIGFSLRKRAGKTSGLIGESVFVTAALMGMGGMSVAMLMSYLGWF